MELDDTGDVHISNVQARFKKESLKEMSNLKSWMKRSATTGHRSEPMGAPTWQQC